MGYRADLCKWSLIFASLAAPSGVAGSSPGECCTEIQVLDGPYDPPCGSGTLSVCDMTVADAAGKPRDTLNPYLQSCVFYTVGAGEAYYGSCTSMPPLPGGPWIKIHGPDESGQCCWLSWAAWQSYSGGSGTVYIDPCNGDPCLP